MYSKIVIKQAYRWSLWLNLHCHNGIRKVKFILPLTQNKIAPTHKMPGSATDSLHFNVETKRESHSSYHPVISFSIKEEEKSGHRWMIIWNLFKTNDKINTFSLFFCIEKITRDNRFTSSLWRNDATRIIVQWIITRFIRILP